MPKTIPLSDAKTHLSKIINDVVDTHEVFAISKGGVPAAALMSIEEYESLIETIEILSDPALMKAIGKAEKDKKAGRLLTHEEVWHDL